MRRVFISKYFYVIVIGILLPLNEVLSQQISISRIEQMPNSPSSFEIPDWKNVAIEYDSLVYNLNAAGEYLPLIFIITNTINYPAQNSFGLHSYVGTNYPNLGEAINVIPSIIGASLSGIDKSNQNGYNWVLMSEEYFNKRKGEEVYLNTPNSSSGNDWWYDTMPNVFFYQLYSLYPSTGDFNYQFTSVANRWLKALTVMGGSATPWNRPSMNYRAWFLSEMKGNNSGVPEPEAAGAIAWILYNAYSQTSDQKYRIGAEWAMEYLNSLNSNPSYELQLPYGAYIAARMNAELNTNYDIEKIVNWCFDVGPLRSWGLILGKWGNYEVNGLIGEVNGNNDYAFAMNTIEQVGALVPLVRYDDRFARAIGKWVLNTVNSVKYFYPKYLPDSYQDNKAWSNAHDPESIISYEALRQRKYGLSPYGTGDAVDGGWANTNLALYGASHIGILGGIVDTTNIKKILKLDLLKTDYFHSNAYQSYLYYNPYEVSKSINFVLPSGSYDLYDAVSNTFIQKGKSGSTQFDIGKDSALLLVLVPSGKAVTYDLNRTIVDNVVIDYNSGRIIANYPPRIKALVASDDSILVNSQVNIYSTAEDREGGNLIYSWRINGQLLANDSSAIQWTAPNIQGLYSIENTVTDNTGSSDTSSIVINVLERINHPPIIESIIASPRKLDLNGETTIIISVSDLDGDSLNYTWSAGYGSITGSGKEILWTAPNNEGNYYILCEVDDQNGGIIKDSISVEVRDFSKHVVGNLIAYYPFNGNANDETGNNNNGTVYGARLTSDRFGNINSAYSFNGVNDYILVGNNDMLNFTEAISLNFWMKVGQFYQREAYPISHGNWEKRWKVSITQNRLRWTINTSTGIYDLDSESLLKKDSLYNITLTYSGSDVEIYLNGKLDAFGTWNGLINKTQLGLTIGQALPNNSSYNFNGILDDIRIFNYALSLSEVKGLFSNVTDVKEDKNYIPTKSKLLQNYPNPFNGSTQIEYSLNRASIVEIKVYDILGRYVTTLVNEKKGAGVYRVKWNAEDEYKRVQASGIYFVQMKTDNFIDTKKVVFLK